MCVCERGRQNTGRKTKQSVVSAFVLSTVSPLSFYNHNDNNRLTIVVTIETDDIYVEYQGYRCYCCLLYGSNYRYPVPGTSTSTKQPILPHPITH